MTRTGVPRGDSITRYLRWAGWGWFLLTLVVTLWPSHGMPRRISMCLICGERGGADAVLNTILFLPIGALAASYIKSPLRATAVGGLLSLLIEVLQLVFLPGRNPSVGDVVFNTAGALLGAYAVPRIPGLLSLSPILRRRGRWAATLGVILILWWTNALLQPDVLRTTWVGQWTPRLGNLAPYLGLVHDAQLSGTALVPNTLDDPVHDSVQNALTIDVTFRTGPLTPKLAPIVSVFDTNHRGVVLFGADRDQVVLQRRRMAERLALDVPDVRWPLTWPIDETIGVRVEENDAGQWCLSGTAIERECVARLDPSLGWSLLMYGPGSTPKRRAALSFLWMAGLALIPGLFSRRWQESTTVMVSLAAGVGLLVVAGVPPIPLPFVLGIIPGVLLGEVIGRIVERSVTAAI